MRCWIIIDIELSESSAGDTFPLYGSPGITGINLLSLLYNQNGGLGKVQPWLGR